IMSTPDYIYPIIVPSDSDVEDAFSSTNTPDYTLVSSEYSPASPGNTSSDPSEDLSPIAPLTVLPPYPVLPPSPLFDPRDFFLFEEILPPQKRARSYHPSLLIPLPYLRFVLVFVEAAKQSVSVTVSLLWIVDSERDRLIVVRFVSMFVTIERERLNVD
ncbi:hypothetical protein Tco_0353457, partial [Tanacetum coccineum]